MSVVDGYPVLEWATVIMIRMMCQDLKDGLNLHLMVSEAKGHAKETCKTSDDLGPPDHRMSQRRTRAVGYSSNNVYKHIIGMSTDPTKKADSERLQ